MISELASDSTVEAWASNARREIAELRARAENWIASRAVAGNVVSFPRLAIPLYPSKRGMRNA
jgi:hypothetical protein